MSIIICIDCYQLVGVITISTPVIFKSNLSIFYISNLFDTYLKAFSLWSFVYVLANGTAYGNRLQY